MVIKQEMLMQVVITDFIELNYTLMHKTPK